MSHALLRRGPGCNATLARIFRRWWLVLSWALTLACPAACAGEFTVAPLRLELGGATRSGVLSVRNEGKENLSFQLQAMEWTQDGQGKDSYGDTSDLIFFPKLMTLAPGEESVVRVGVKAPIVAIEKTYRLFIEELPGPVAIPGKGAQLNVLIRFAAPIFIRPSRPEDRLELEKLQLAQGELSLVARNSGNQHQVMEGIELKGLDRNGREIYAKTLTDRYLLAGTANDTRRRSKRRCAQTWRRSPSR